MAPRVIAMEPVGTRNLCQLTQSRFISLGRLQVIHADGFYILLITHIVLERFPWTIPRMDRDKHEFWSCKISKRWRNGLWGSSRSKVSKRRCTDIYLCLIKLISSRNNEPYTNARYICSVFPDIPHYKCELHLSLQVTCNLPSSRSRFEIVIRYLTSITGIDR